MRIPSFVLGSALLAAVRAAPLETRAIAQTLLSQLSFYEQYAASAYCEANNQPGSSTEVECDTGNCPLVQAANATSVLEFQNEGPADATGYLAVDHTNKLIVLAFRGSHSLSNWISNINILFKDWSLCSGCRVHAGFLESWTATRNDVAAPLKAAVAANPGYPIVATGHSLGAAVATLAAAELRTQGYNVGLYTYGSPMVGNNAFATFVTNQSGGNYRVTHANDIVPKLPGLLFGYRHVSPEYWITSATNVAVTAADVQVSTGTLNLNGNGGTVESSLDDHGWYFNAISACAPEGFELRRKDGSDVEIGYSSVLS
ncbi:hypothetical protein H2203_007333 [Taxawa tesnikishii (nom. ined.)]|nr:hypothetical protein H2203_007333 [Dothideales sp. JES 119]